MHGPPPSPFQDRAIAYDTTFRFVIPAERRQAREPGPKNPCLALISECRDTWVPDRLASLAVRDDKPKGCKKVICDSPAPKGEGGRPKADRVGSSQTKSPRVGFRAGRCRRNPR